MKGISCVSVRGVFLMFAGFAAACAFLYEWPSATAQSTPTRLVTVDVETVFMQSKMGRAAVDQLKKQQEEFQRQVTAEKDVAKRQQLLKEAETKMAEARQQAIAGADVKIMPVINTVGKELKAAAIFRKFESGIIYVDDSLDITTTVIQRLDAATP